MSIATASDLNRARGIDAYRLTSFSPERRADQDIAGYVQEVAEFAAMLAEIAETDAQKAEAEAQVERYRLKSIEWQNTLWAAKARTASPMITGPARFPVDRNRKAMNAEHKKVGLWLEWLPRVRAAAKRAVAEAGQPPKVPEKANEVVTIEGVDIVSNYEIDRVQIVFGGKPDPETIAALKGAAWNWSPRNSAWQRKRTDAAIRSATKIVQATVSA